ncbi:hypothetical protein PO878_21605 [Iamia majanohamensis]|uniref:Glutamine amidotransferase domain-containing protein n=1 Tax=Iamia majanohamensis TaxID=467976 RepID=A0AAF0BVJ1_9ACTN|nr:hypothetical protein [Iamia majanohamensis]WCO67088.1 hypothetical protein PO878_21605 [Iamia majanohamensis]
MDAIIWEGSGSPWRGATWGGPVAARLTALGLRTRTVPWGASGLVHRGRPDVLHVFTGGMEPVASGSPEMEDRMGAVTAAVVAAGEGACSVLGICLGAQMIAAAASGLEPVPAAGGGEAGTTTVRSQHPDVADVVVGTAHTHEVPRRFLAGDGVEHLWANDVTRVQGFRLGGRVVGVQFHPELSGPEAGRASRAFRRALGAPPAHDATDEVDPAVAMGAVLVLAGVGAPTGAEAPAEPA